MNRTRSRITSLLFLSAALLPAARSAAQAPYSVAPPEKNNTPAAQLKSFTIDKRFEVNLFADETMGIANPICFRWDAGGRLWVLCTWAYPQLKPGEPANDKLMILEDTTGDGKADRVSTFADGLNMPTGFALGHGGAYIGNGPDLIHVRDSDGNGKADRREVLFSGFGTGDTHQNINSFAWTPGGELLFCQGLHCFSRVQTPWGIRRLDEHGSWRLRPLRRQLHSYRRSSGGGNPWGYAFGDWGEPFIKSNGGGISEFLPSMVHTDHITGGYWGGAMQIGATKIKSMVTEIVDSPHLPDDLQGDFLIAGYFARNIARLRPSVDGAGHKLKTLAPLLTSTHSAFRPVDLNVGPDGAIYVADWFNPIIGHYQASFRHPDRDQKRGRIWRISARGRPLDKPPALADMTAAELCKQLAAPTRWVSQQAKLRLMDLPKAEALAATRSWVKSLDASDPELEHKLYEAIGVFESHEEVNRPLLERLLNARDPRARAYAARVLGRWHDRLDNPLALLQQRAADENPRVRLEALVAASDVRTAGAIAVVARAADGPADRFINFAFSQAVHALASKWKPELLAGRLDFGRPAHLSRVVGTIGGEAMAGVVRQQLASGELASERQAAMLELLAGIGSPADAELVLKLGSSHPGALRALATSFRERGLKAPASATERLGPALSSPDKALRIEALTLCGLWKLNAHTPAILRIAVNPKEVLAVRAAAAEALGALSSPSVGKELAGLTAPGETPTLRQAALASLARHDATRAAERAAALLKEASPAEIGPLLAALLQRSDGAKALAGALGETRISADTAKLARRWINAAGRNEPALTVVLDKLIGVQGSTAAYSPAYVAALEKDALAGGNAARGRKLFELPLLSCTSCHAVDGVKGASTSVKGPNLSALAAGVPTNIIIESVLWPDRQIKEGYLATTVVTKAGKVLSGLVHSEDKKTLRLLDLASGKITTTQAGAILRRTRGGTVMPPGLTASLTRAELRDLIKYLSTLKAGGQPK